MVNNRSEPKLLAASANRSFADLPSSLALPNGSSVPGAEAYPAVNRAGKLFDWDGDKLSNLHNHLHNHLHRHYRRGPAGSR